MKESLKEMIADDEFYELQAISTKKLIDSLINQGFTREEAISLIVRK